MVSWNLNTEILCFGGDEGHSEPSFLIRTTQDANQQNLTACDKHGTLNICSRWVFSHPFWTTNKSNWIISSSTWKSKSQKPLRPPWCITMSICLMLKKCGYHSHGITSCFCSMLCYVFLAQPVNKNITTPYAPIPSASGFGVVLGTNSHRVFIWSTREPTSPHRLEYHRFSEVFIGGTFPVSVPAMHIIHIRGVIRVLRPSFSPASLR